MTGRYDLEVKENKKKVFGREREVVDHSVDLMCCYWFKLKNIRDIF